MTASHPPRPMSCPALRPRSWPPTSVAPMCAWPGSSQRRCRPPGAGAEYRKYRNADHAGLSAILSDFLGEGPRPTHCVVASAGYAREDGTVITANLPWPLSARQVEADVGLQRVYIVNDFEAVATPPRRWTPVACCTCAGRKAPHAVRPWWSAPVPVWAPRCGSPPRTARWFWPPRPASRLWRPAPNWKWPSSATCSATARTCRSSMRSPAPA